MHDHVTGSADIDEILDLLIELVAIDSVNPSLDAQGAGEAAVAAHVAAWATRHGLEVHLDEVVPGRPNVVVVARGTGGGSSIMLNAHLDVVGVEGYPDPFTVVIRDGRIHGRGVLDTKVGVATALVHARRARDLGLRGDVVVAAVADEESGSIGTEALVRTWTTDAAVVLEPTELALVTDHRGWAWGRITIHGRAAHGSRPDLGIDAIAAAGPVLSGITALQTELGSRPAHPVLGHGSVHASLIAGGHEMSTYPQTCVIDIERRLLDTESVEDFAAELDRLAGLASAPATATAVTTFSRSALHTPGDAAIVSAVLGAFDDVGRTVTPSASSFWTDAALLHDAGIPSVVFGPGGGGIHENDEWLDLDSFAVFEQVLWRTVVRICS